MGLATQIEERLHELPSKRRQVVADGLCELTRELVEQSKLTDNLKKVEATGRAAVDAARLLMTGTSRQVARLTQVLAELRSETDATEISSEELEASGRLQVLALYRGVEEDSLSVAELEEAGLSRQRLKQLRDQNRLLAVRLPFRRGFVYPRWQFREDLRPREYLPEILAAAHEEGLDALTIHQLLTRPGPDGGSSLLELCEQGRIVSTLNALRTVGELGA